MFLGSHYQRVVTKDISDISSNTALLCSSTHCSYAREILLSDFVTPVLLSKPWTPVRRFFGFSHTTEERLRSSHYIIFGKNQSFKVIRICVNYQGFGRIFRINTSWMLLIDFWCKIVQCALQLARPGACQISYDCSFAFDSSSYATSRTFKREIGS